MTALAKSSEPSMEEILASIRRIIADDHQATIADAPAPSPAPSPPRPVAAPVEDVLDLAVEARPVEVKPVEAKLVEAKPVMPEPETRGQDDIDLLFAEPEPEPVEPQRLQPAPVRSAPPPHSDLLSAATSASIAGAFSSLSHTLLSTNARTLEDLVQDMMKPMLKTWLDDNLPTIVERLVRAEIERVARGSR